MLKPTNEVGVTLGRYSWPTEAHRDNIEQAARQVKKLFVGIGSANERPSPKNPFIYEQRAELFRAILSPEIQSRVHFAPLNDYGYSDDHWKMDVKLTVANMIQRFVPEGFDGRMKLFGHKKDETSYYLDHFPEWEEVALGEKLGPHGELISATDLRKAWFEDAMNSHTHAQLPHVPGYLNVVHGLINRKCWMSGDVLAEYHYYTYKEKERFKDYPFPEELNFACADAVVTCLGHVLLMKRKNNPGLGVWSLVGSFKKSRETYQECALRALRDKVGLRIAPKVLLGSLKNTKLYDKPNRGLGLPRHSQVFYFRVEPNANGSLPEIQPGVDGYEARWVLLEQAMNDGALWDDHQYVISDQTGVYQSPAFLYRPYL